MVTATVYVLLFLAGMAVVFPRFSTARSPQFAFLAFCWIPSAALAFIYVLANQLGYALFAYAIVDLVASIVISTIGAYQCIAAARRKTGMRSLILGTLIAAAPLAVVGAWLLLG